MNNNETIIPFLYYPDDTLPLFGRIVILINYLEISESAMLIALQKMIQKFWVISISTQRNYNDFSSTIFKKTVMKGYVALCSDSYEQYFNELGKKTRFNINYYTKKLYKQYGEKIVFNVYIPNEFSYALFLKFVDLVDKRYNKKYWEGFTKKTTFYKLSNHILATTMIIDGNYAAFNIFYVHKDTLVFTGNTFDEKYKQYSLGFIHTANSIKWAFQNGYKKVILGPGDFGYKARLSNAIETLYEYNL